MKKEIAYENIITIGSHLYNSVTRYFQDNEISPFLVFSDLRSLNNTNGSEGNELCVLVNRGSLRDLILNGRSKNRELAIIQRIKNTKTGVMIMFCSGTGQSATMGAVQYLSRNWKNISQEYIDLDFALCLAFPYQADADSEQVVSEIELLKIVEGRNPEITDMSIYQSREFIFREFFEMNFRAVMLHYSWVKDYIRHELENADDSIVRDAVFQIQLDEYVTYFNLADGEVRKRGEILLSMDFKVFQELIFIDYGRWRSKSSFTDGFLEFFVEADESNNDDVRRFLANWYEMLHNAAKAFFEDDGGDRKEYLSQFSILWWNPNIERQEKHITYENKLRSVTNFSDKRVLEVGCGFGRLRRVFNSASHVLHVDISERMIAEAKKVPAGSGDEFLVCDIEEVRLGTLGEFDAICIFQVTMHLRDPIATIQRLIDCLGEDGSIWADFTCSHDMKGIDYYQESFFTRIYSEEFLRRQLEAAGFRITDEYQTKDRNDHYWWTVSLRHSSQVSSEPVENAA